MVKTVTLAADTPQKITFEGTYPYYWIDNKTADSVYASVAGVPTADADDTYTIAAGSQLRVSGGVGNNGITLLGEGKVQVIASTIAACPFKSTSRGGDDNEIKLMPFAAGLSRYFDYRYGVSPAAKTWTDRVNNAVCSADGDFEKAADHIKMNESSFALSFDGGLSSYTIYAIICADQNTSGWTSLVADYGATPQFNLCNNSGMLAIGAGTTYGRYISNIPSYGEWHVACLTLDEGFGVCYIDGIRKNSYDGYSKPRFKADYPLCFGYGDVKLLAVCENVAHGQAAVQTNSEWLRANYIN